MTLEPPFVKVTQTGAVLRLTLSRPEQRNPLSLGMLSAMNAEIDAAADDTSVAVIVIAAEGPAFSAGHDLKELTAARTAPDQGQAFFQDTFAQCSRLMQAIVNCPKPVITEVHAIATAAGCQLVASCDLAIASVTAKFATPGVNLGLFCSTPSVALTRTIAPKHAMQMLLTGDPISAEEAHRIGLVNQVVPLDELTGTVNNLASRIADKPQSVIVIGKQAVRAQIGLSLADAYSVAENVMVRNLLLPDAVRGIARLIDKNVK